MGWVKHCSTNKQMIKNYITYICYETSKGAYSIMFSEAFIKTVKQMDYLMRDFGMKAMNRQAVQTRCMCKLPT